MALASPAEMAASFPKFLEKCSPCILFSLSAKFFIFSYVVSVEPSSIKIISLSNNRSSDKILFIKFILDSENIKYTRESLKAFIEESFKFYPDCRRIVNYLQFCCGSGELVVKLSQIADSGKDEFLKDLFVKIQKEKDLLNVRKFYLANKEKVSDFIAFGSDIFNYALDNNMVTGDGVLVLAELLYQLNVVIDKEVGLFAMITATRKYSRS